MSEYPAITELVPHAAPMIALEELVEWREGFARARLVIREDDPFLRGGRVESVVTLEYMAQAVAACLGMESYRSGTSIRVGMIVACRELVLLRPSLALGEELSVEAECVRGSDHTSHFETRVLDAVGKAVARATLTLVHGVTPPG